MFRRSGVTALALLAALALAGGVAQSEDAFFAGSRQSAARVIHLKPGVSSADALYVAGADASPAASRNQGRPGKAVSNALPAWSPDGKRIAFTRERGGVLHVYVMNANGRNQRKLTRLPGSFFPLWSRDGRRIAFLRGTGGGRRVWLYVMSAAGRNQRRLTRISVSGWGYHPPVWAPDGRRIAFTRTSGSFASGGQHPQIYVINADGSAERVLTPTAGDVGSSSPSWSPDGREIAFVHHDLVGFDRNIAIMDSDGSNRRTLTKDLRSVVDTPVWSSDGQKLVFQADGIYVMNADGSEQRRLTQIDVSAFSSPVWSPDSRQIAFARAKGGLSFVGDRIYVINADGSDQRLLVKNSRGVGSPTWSPDGRNIAFVLYGLDGGGDIYVMNADGSNQRRLTR